ncbi:MAG: ABC transporter permease subunit [Clostridia bacterium]|nr:ABC transporter permease subunit [Clostridia bacterium]
MLDLLKADLKRAIKDRLFIVLCIIAGAFAVITPLLYKGMLVLLEWTMASTEGLEMFELTMTAKSMFFGTFSFGGDFGLILPIFVAIILCKDFSNGTIRNKITCGKSRRSIYFSLLITCSILTCAFMLAHALLTLLVSLIFFEYQSTPFSWGDFGYLMASIGLQLLCCLFVCALLTFFIVFMKNAGLAIVMYFVVSFLMTIVGSITQTMVMPVPPDEIAYNVLEFFNAANVFMSSIIGSGTTYQLKELLYFLLPTVAFTAIFVTLGLVAFRKKDLK